DGDELVEVHAEEDFEGYGFLVLSFVKTMKAFVNRAAHKIFTDKLKAKYQGEEERKVIRVIRYMEIKGNPEDIEYLEAQAQKSGISLEQLMDVYIEYSDLKTIYYVSEMPEWTEQGIEKWTIRTMRYYAVEKPNPLVILCAFLFFGFMLDALKLGFNVAKDHFFPDN
ncbi:MAG: hypothetical protein AAFQ92_28420, partial [Bacteroidota bacterium]